MSVVEQTHQVTEILVYDDCSTDETADVVARLAKSHQAIRLFRGKENRGAGHARAALLEAATADFFAFLDADDYWLPTKLQKQLEFMHRNGVDISVCDYEIIDPKGRKVAVRRLPQEITRFKMHMQNEIPTSMAVLRSDLIGCREMVALRRRQDYAYWLTIFARNPDAKCLSIAEVLGVYSRTPGSLSASPLKNLAGNFRMFRETQGYSVPLSLICVLANILKRASRIVG